MNWDIFNEVMGAAALAISLWDLRKSMNSSTLYDGFFVFLAVVWGFAAVGAMVVGNTVAAVTYGGDAAIQAWIWWSRRPPRQRRPSKALGAIRDLGHRLVVTS